MDFWNQQASQLEMALLDNVPALVLHFIRTAAPDAVEALSGDALPANANMRASVIATLTTRLDRSIRPACAVPETNCV